MKELTEGWRATPLPYRYVSALADLLLRGYPKMARNRYEQPPPG